MKTLRIAQTPTKRKKSHAQTGPATRAARVQEGPRSLLADPAPLYVVVQTSKRRPFSTEDLRRAGLPENVYPHGLFWEDGNLHLDSRGNSTATTNAYILKLLDDDVSLARTYCQKTPGATPERVCNAFPLFTVTAPGRTPQEKLQWVDRQIIAKQQDADPRSGSLELYANYESSSPELGEYRPTQMDIRHPHEIQAELAAKFYRNLRTLRYATRIKYKAEATLRSEHPEMIDFWRAVDALGSSVREEFFHGKLWGKRSEQMFEFIAALLNETSGATVYDRWKRCRPR